MILKTAKGKRKRQKLGFSFGRSIIADRMQLEVDSENEKWKTKKNGSWLLFIKSDK